MSKAKKTPENKLETVEQIRAKAAAATPDPAKFKRAMRHTEAALVADGYEWNRSKSTVDGLPIHYFRVRGEALTGILGAADYELWKGHTYRLILDDGTVVRLPGNRQLNKLIKASECVYQRITITYLGKLYRHSHHYEKVYSIVPAPNEGVGRAGRKLIQQAAAEAAAKRQDGQDNSEGRHK